MAEDEPCLGVDEMLAVIARAPDLFKALELNDRSWIGRDDVEFSFLKKRRSDVS